MITKEEKNIFSYLSTTHRMDFSDIYPLIAITCETGLVGRFGRQKRR